MVAGFVLAGGRSERMGVDKARLPWRGRPMAEALAGVLREAGCDPVQLIRRGQPDGLPWQSAVVREDERLPRHVLSGFITALDAARGAAVVCACDLYALGPDVVRAVVSHPGSVAWDEGPAILAHVTPEDRTSLHQAVAQGESFRDWAAARPVVDGAGQLANANRWEHLGCEHPVHALVERLHLRGSEADRAARGERARLAAIGCLLP